MYKVKCTLIEFEKGEDLYPCHFNYKIGEAFYYDGVEFKGRICPGLFASMMPVITEGQLESWRKSKQTLVLKYQEFWKHFQFLNETLLFPSLHLCF